MAIDPVTGSLIGGGISAVGSLFGADKASSAADRAARQQAKTMADDLAFRREQYNRYLGLFGPTEERLAKEAMSSEPLDYDPNAAAIRQNYGQSMRDIARTMGMRGMAGSGTDVGASRGAAFRQAGDLSNAWAQGLINRRKLGLDLTGRGQIGQSAQNLQGGMQGMANYFGGQSNLYNAAAQQGWQNFGQGLQGMAERFYSQQQPPSLTTPIQTGNFANPLQPTSGGNYGNLMSGFNPSYRPNFGG